MRALMMVAFATCTFVFAQPGPAAAEPEYPWCIIDGGPQGGTMSCGFVSEEQCRWSRGGNTDMCVINPRYDAARNTQQPPRRKVQQRPQG